MHKLRATILGGEGHVPVSTSAPKRPSALRVSLSGIPVKRETSRTTHQRVADRLPGVMAETTLSVHRSKHEVAVSSDGVMIEADIELRIGERVAIVLPDGNSGKCVVRWIHDGRVGMEFDGFALEIGRTLTGAFTFRRDEAPKRKITDRAVRKSRVWTATLHADAEMVAVKLCNISTSGAQLDCNLPLEPGTAVLLSLGGAGFMPSKVRWSEGGRMGLSFDRNFDVEMLTVCAEQDSRAKAIEWCKPEYLMDERSPDSPWAACFDKLPLADLPPTR